MNPLVPAVVALAGFGWAAAHSLPVGLGIAIGAALALVNGVLLSQRVDLAAASGDVARALLSMQLSLLLTMTVVAVVAFVLIKLSLAMAIAAAAGFAFTHLAILIVFYLTRGRVDSRERTAV